MTKLGDITAKRVLPFSIEPKIWDGLSAKIRRLLWDGWSLKLQLSDLAYSRRHADEVDEARRQAGPVKPIAPLTPAKLVKRDRMRNRRVAQLQNAKQAAANRISSLQQKVADEDKFVD